MHGVRRITTFGLTLALCTSVLGCASPAAHLLATPLWQANDGAFGASMYLINDHDKLLRDWSSPAQPFDLATLPTAERVARGTPIYVVLFFANCLERTGAE